MVSFLSSLRKPHYYLNKATLLGVFFALFSLLSFPSKAVDVIGSWENVANSQINQSSRVFVRGVGYYTDNTIEYTGSDALSGQLRLVVTSSNFNVTNAVGLDDSSRPYFDLTTVSDTTRIYFQRKRGRLTYTAQLQQFIASEPDTDGDGIVDREDVCPFDADNDIDGDGICGDIDVCPLDIDNDIDGDGICGDIDVCPLDIDNDIDNDGICGDIDVCPLDPGNDDDADGICFADDICPEDTNNLCIVLNGLVFGNGSSISGAPVKIGLNSVNTSSDVAGEFSANVGPNEFASDGVDNFFPVKVTAEGFATGNTKVIFVPGVYEYSVTVDLQQVSAVIELDDDLNEGVEINKDGEDVGKLTIPTSSLPDNVTGVSGEITYLDPATDDILSTPGGDLLALPAGANPNEDAPVTLETFGMMEFNLFDQNGNEISELAGPAEVCMKAPDGLSLGDVIPLWYYDEDQGLWVEEGQGSVVRNDSNLEICGAVTHFSWWNYDQPINTHSCMSFDIQSDSNDDSLDGLSWYAQGVTYSGTAPSRVCGTTPPNSSFDSFTVKISSDANNPEQIQVYTLIGGTKFFLAEDGSEFELVQDKNAAAVFNTPSVQGSCLSGSLSGSCTPLDGDDGILIVNSEINLPPVITDFDIDSYRLLQSEATNVSAFVVDPEGSPVDILWDVNCSYYGESDGDESITPELDTGSSGTEFNAVMTAPSTLTYQFMSCQITINATDADGLSSTAYRWVTVTGGLLYEISGVIYDPNGQPFNSTPEHELEKVYYYHYCDESFISKSTEVNESGEYSLSVDLSDCVDDEYGYLYYYGELTFSFEVDDLSWQHWTTLDNYGGEFERGIDGGLQCEFNGPGSATECEQDLHVPTVWGLMEGDLYRADTSIDHIVNISTYNMDDFYIQSYSDLYLDSYNYFDENNSEIYGPLMVPIGRGEVTILEASSENPSFYDITYDTEYNKFNTELSRVDVGDVVSPVLFTTFEGGAPLPGVTLSGWADDSFETVTDVNGEAMVDLALGEGYVSAYFSGSSYILDRNFFNSEVSLTPKLIDIGSTDVCMVSGNIYDRFGNPAANETYNFEMYTGGGFGSPITSFTTDSNGEYSLMTNPGTLSIYFYDFDSEGFLEGGVNKFQIDHCRGSNGAPREITIDTVVTEGFYSLEF